MSQVMKAVTLPKFLVVALVSGVLLFSIVMLHSLVYAATAVDEDFSSTPLNADLEDPDGAYTIAGGVISKTTFFGNDVRSYIRTVDTDYNTVDFVAELTFTLTDLPGGNFTIQYFGLGPGTGDPTFFTESPGVLFRIHGSDIVGGRVDAAAKDFNGPFSALINIGNITTSGGTHRARITKSGNLVVFAIDRDFTTGPFVADITSPPLDLAVVAPFLDSTNSRIFFGTASALDVFDDLLITVSQPVTPAGATQNLIGDVEGLNLPNGIENSLVKKLDSAIAALEREQDIAAVNKLNAFINQVEGLKGKKIGEADADALIADAQVIICAIDPTQPNCT